MNPEIILLSAARWAFRLRFLAVVIFALAAAGSISAQTGPPPVPEQVVRQANVCVNNLAGIFSAKRQWALENHKSTNDIPTSTEVALYLKSNKMPACTGTGEYSIGRVGEVPGCTIPSHKLSPEYLAIWNAPDLLQLLSDTNSVAIAYIRAQNSCLKNLRQIDAAKQQSALENHKTIIDVLASADIAPYLTDNKVPICPAGGTYTIGHLDETPICSLPGHTLTPP